jgi:hypothetical protein
MHIQVKPLFCDKDAILVQEVLDMVITLKQKNGEEDLGLVEQINFHSLYKELCSLTREIEGKMANQNWEEELLAEKNFSKWNFFGEERQEELKRREEKNE